MDTAVADVVAGRPGAAGRLEQQLSERWHAGDRDAADALLDDLAACAGASPAAAELLARVTYRLHLARPSLRRLLFSAEDVAEAEQMTVMAMAKGIAGFGGRARYRTWLFTVARNEATALLRRRQRRGVEVDFEDATSGGSAFVASMSSVVITGDEVRRAIDELAEPFRAAVVLRELDGLSYAEIAEQLGRNLETVKSQIHRGRGLVQQRLAERLALKLGP